LCVLFFYSFYPYDLTGFIPDRINFDLLVIVTCLGATCCSAGFVCNIALSFFITRLLFPACLFHSYRCPLSCLLYYLGRGFYFTRRWAHGIFIGAEGISIYYTGPQISIRCYWSCWCIGDRITKLACKQEAASPVVFGIIGSDNGSSAKEFFVSAHCTARYFLAVICITFRL